MSRIAPIRSPHTPALHRVCTLLRLEVAIAVLLSLGAHAQGRSGAHPSGRPMAAPQPRQSAPMPSGGNQGSRQYGFQSAQNQPLVRPGRPDQAQQHLSQWMESHRNLPLAQQHSALEAEPGFHNLRPEEQQRMHNQLSRLNSMPPEQRQIAIARTEWMERLAPQQRQQVRNAMAQLGSLPPERARAVGRTFRSMQSYPEPQRQAYLNSPQAHAEFNDQERATLGNLLHVAPLIPPAQTPQTSPR